MSGLERKMVIILGTSKVKMIDQSSTPIFSSQSSGFATQIISTTKKQNTNHNFHQDKEFNYPLLVVLPTAILIFLLLLIFLVIFIRRKLRKRQLQRDLLPHYGYDHSEAEVFDGYTQFPDELDGFERIYQDNNRLKVSSPESTDKSVVSAEYSTNEDEKPAGTSTPKRFTNDLAI